MTKPILNMMVGNIGCGKSTIANKLHKQGCAIIKQGCAVVNMDSIQSCLAGGEYGAYNNDWKDLYHDIETQTITSALQKGISVCIDRTNMDKARRKRYIDVARPFVDDIRCYNFGAGNERALSRRIKNSRGIPEQQWKQVFEYMQSVYQEPTLSEGFTDIIQPPEKFEFHAIDFDGTIVKNDFPAIGEVNTGLVAKMNDLYQDLKNIIIIWTNRSGDFEAQAKQFLLKNKIPFDFINENPIWESGSRKVFAHKYYDDRNVNFSGEYTDSF